MIEAYMQATLDVLRLAGQLFLARMDDQLRWFSDDLRAFIFDLERNPRRDWRERFDAMLAEQASRACVITPESRATLIAYLEIWEQNVFGRPPQPSKPKPKSSAHPGGVLNPLNWPRAIYTGDANSTDADYAAAMEAMGEYYRDNAGRTHQQLQIINSFDPTYLTTVVDGILTTAEGEELHAIVMENQSDALGAILTATEVLGQIRDAKNAFKTIKDAKQFSKFADEVGSSTGTTNSSLPRNAKVPEPIVKVKFQKWRKGDAIDKPMPDGSPPSWDTVQSRYWRNRHELSKDSGEFTPRQLAEMRKGNAPLDYNPRTKQAERRELHHVDPQRHGTNNGPINIREITPDWHAEVDPFRRVRGVNVKRGGR